MTNDTRLESQGGGAAGAAAVNPASLPDAGHPPWRALVALLVGTFITAIDFFIVNVALPSIQHDLKASTGDLEWFVAAYALGTAVFLMAAARLGDRFGRRGAFVTGIAVFTAASVLCTLAPDPGVLIAARLVQGIGTAFVMTSVLSMIGVLFPGATRPRAIAFYAAVLGVGAAAGQIIGGALIASDVAGLGWRAIFAVNVPVGILALVLAPLLVPRTRPANSLRVDAVGMVLMTAAVFALVLPLIQGGQTGWAPWTWVSFALVPLLVAGFAVYERALEARGGSSLFPRMLLATPAFRAGLLWQLVFWCGQSSFFVVLTLFLQQGRSLSALAAGCLFIVMALPYVAATFVAPQLMRRLGRGVLVLGGGANLLGLAALAVVALAEAPTLWLAIGFVLCGIGQGLSIPPSTGIVLATADPSQAGVVSGALSTMQQVGACIGVALVGGVFFGTIGAGVPIAYAVAVIPLAAACVLATVLTGTLPRARGAR
ncbi:MAG TPA: MFS transporter [Humibacter sp.]|jgi:MFS family permease|nr:MFS transporter [Humibacter sp.]